MIWSPPDLSACSNLLLEMDVNSQRESRLGIFSKEFRIILFVIKNPGSSIKETQGVSGLSPRGFYLKLREMTESGIIEIVEDKVDRRIRRLQLGPNGTPLFKQVEELDRLLKSDPRIYASSAQKTA